MFDDASRPAARHGGLTLVEVCLVLALLVVVSSVTFPLLGGAIDRRALTSGADLLRAAWSRARLAAMQSGETYVVRLEPHGSRFQILSLEQLGLPESQELPADDSETENSPADILRISRNRLPNGVIIANADVSNWIQWRRTLVDADPVSTRRHLLRHHGVTTK
jgi:type II secretory pathway pseudopilin PulG